MEYAFWHISLERSRQAQILAEAVGTNAIKYSKQGNSSSDF
ncbi:MAG: hypothetical protein V7K40_15835 [Nostoc sp.]